MEHTQSECPIGQCLNPCGCSQGCRFPPKEVSVTGPILTRSGSGAASVAVSIYRKPSLLLGLDPAQIKYVIPVVAKTQILGGAKMLQDRYQAHVLFSAADWDVIEKANFQAAVKPRKDMVVTDGQKLTLGDVTVTLYVTSGNTPGTVSMLVSPLKDGNQKHVGAAFGGRSPYA